MNDDNSDILKRIDALALAIARLADGKPAWRPEIRELLRDASPSMNEDDLPQWRGKHSHK